VDIQTFLRSRRSIRHFQTRDVDPAILKRILETAFFAPSAHNRQPWRFAVLTTLEVKEKLSDMMAAEFRTDLAREGLPVIEINKRIERSKTRVLKAPIAIVLCLDESEMDEYPDVQRQQAETTMAIQSVSMAGLQLLLAAHSEGLGGVWTCSPLFAPEVVKSSIALPETWVPQALLLLGYPDETPLEKKLKKFNELVIYID
jgi:coenzyme F420-0:L-glutamate ligase / coenzyme F420-1:gamma-L-glutamate ligase